MRTVYLFRGCYHSQPNIEIEQYESVQVIAHLRLSIVNKRGKKISKIALKREQVSELIEVLKRYE